MELERSLATFGWQQMHISEILKLCSVNKAFNNLCNNPDTWNFLIHRDFKISNEDPKKEYFGHILKELARQYNDRANDLYQRFINSELPPTMDQAYVNEERIRLKDFALSALGYDDEMDNVNYLGQKIPNNIFGNIVGGKLIYLLLSLRRNLQSEYPNATLIDALLVETYGEKYLLGS